MKTLILFKNVRCIPIIFTLLISINFCEAQVCGINAGLSRTICITEPLTLSGKIGSLESTTPEHLWVQLSGPGVQIENASSLRTNVFNLSPGNYVFQLSGKCIDGLTAKDLVYITVLPEPATPLIGSDTVVCFNTAIQLNANEVNYPNIGTWTVSPKVGSFFPNENSPNAVYTDLSKTPGVKKFTWTISNGNCSKSAVKQITFSEPTVPVYAGNDTTLFCKGKCFFLNGSFPGSGSLQSGIWTVISGPNSPAFSNATKRNSKLCNLIPGIYVLRWTVSGSCVNEFSEITITVLNINEPPISIGDQIYSEYCETPVVTMQVIQGAPKALGDSVIWEQVSGGTNATISPDKNQSRVTIGNLTGRFPYKFNYTQISKEGCEITKSHTIYRAQPLTGLTQPEDLILPCDVTDTLVEISFNRSSVVTGSINRKAIFVSGPVDTGKVERLKTLINSATSTDIWAVKGLGAPGEYIYKFEYENSCGISYRQIKITVSITPGILNPGSDLHLPCMELIVGPIGSVESPGEFVWSQISGPTIALITGENSLNPVIEELSHGVYKFRLSNYGGPACLIKSRDMNIIVTQSPPLTATTGPDAEICAGSYRLLGNAPSLTESGEWSVSPSNGVQFIPNMFTSNAIVSGLNPNTVYTFSWKIKNACGSVSANQILTTGAFYSAPVADAGEDVCLPNGTSSFILRGNNADNCLPVWTSLTDGFVINNPNSASAELFFNRSGTYVFEYSLGSVGCDAIKDTVIVAIKSNTIVRAGDDVKICSDQEFEIVTLNATLQGEDFPGKWNQISGPGNANLISPNNKNISIENLSEGNYAFEYSINYNNSCSVTSDTVLVVINKPPSIANAGDNFSLCNANSNSIITVTGSLPEIGQGSWEIISAPWGNGSTVISNLNSTRVNLSNLFHGIYSLRYTVRNGEVCAPSTDNIDIAVNVKADAGNDISECGSSIITLKGNPNTEGEWSVMSNQQGIELSRVSGNTSIASGITPDLVNSYTFRYLLPAQGNCPATYSDIVYNNFPNPSRAITNGNVSVCSNVSSVILSGNVPESGIAKWNLLSGPNTPIPGESNNTSHDTILKNLVPGIYEYSYSISTHPSCASSIENIFILKELSAKTRSNFRVCEASTISLSANVPLVGVGKWNYESGPSPLGSVTFSDVSNPFATVSGLKKGTHIFKWKISGIENCPSTSNNLEIIIDSSIIELTAGADTTFCQKEGGNFYLGTEEIPGVSYSWMPESLLENASIAKPAFFGGNNSGNYTYTLKGKRGSCESYSVIHLNILPRPFANINISYGSCSVQFTASAPGRGINDPLYKWDFVPSTLSAALGCGPFQINFNSSAPQKAFLKVVSQEGCFSEDTLNFTPYCIVPLKMISFEGKWKNNYSLLNWNIEGPENYKFYEVQRSYSGNNFISIGNVNSFSEIVNYKFEDTDSDLKFEGEIYYRLKTIDFNNEYSYSDIVLLKNINVANIKIGPNPFIDNVSVKFNSKRNHEDVYIKIYNSTGKLVKTQSAIVNSGNSEIILNGLSNLASGTYFLKVTNSYETTSHKIVKKL